MSRTNLVDRLSLKKKIITSGENKMLQNTPGQDHEESIWPHHRHKFPWAESKGIINQRIKISIITEIDI